MAQRESLKTISDNREYNHELSIWDRAQISAYRVVRLSNEQIDDKVFCALATVFTILRLNALRETGKTR